MGDHSEWHYIAGMLFNHNQPPIKLFLFCCGLNVNLSIIRSLNLNIESLDGDGTWEVAGVLLD